MDNLLAASAGDPPPEASSDLDTSLPIAGATAPVGDGGGQNVATTASDSGIIGHLIQTVR